MLWLAGEPKPYLASMECLPWAFTTQWNSVCFWRVIMRGLNLSITCWYRQGLVFASQYDQILVHPWSHDLRRFRSSFVALLAFGVYTSALRLASKDSHAGAGDLDGGEQRRWCAPRTLL